MNKVELMHALVEYKLTKDESPGIANIIQLLIDILVEDIEKEAK